ncbi:hypothetical protein ABZ322_34175, partial [Streptomyces sp. NPDC006129]
MRVVRVGGRCSRSSSEYRLPSGTASMATSCPGSFWSARAAARATAACSRFSAMPRASETCRASTETPGSLSPWVLGAIVLTLLPMAVSLYLS